MFSWFTTDLTERHRGQDEKLNSSIRSILLGFSSQFTDYFAKRITKFLKPRYLLSLVFKIWKQTRSCRKQVVTSVQAWRNSPTGPVLPLSSGSEALPQGENLQRSEFTRSKCFHQPLPSGSLVRLRCWRPAPPVPQEYFRLKKTFCNMWIKGPWCHYIQSTTKTFPRSGTRRRCSSWANGRKETWRQLLIKIFSQGSLLINAADIYVMMMLQWCRCLCCCDP